jgi:hypothetical protein
VNFTELLSLVDISRGIFVRRSRNTYIQSLFTKVTPKDAANSRDEWVKE